MSNPRARYQDHHLRQGQRACEVARGIGIVLAIVTAVASRALAQNPPDTVRWRQIDTVTVNAPDEGCCYSISAIHIEVLGRSGWRKLASPMLPPAQLPSRTLLLRLVNADQSIVLRRYFPSSGAITPIPAPLDYDSAYTYPEFSAARGILAYVIPVRDTGSRIVLRRWPHWELVTQSPAIPRCDDTLLGVGWAHDDRYVLWGPPHCSDASPEVDSLEVPVR